MINIWASEGKRSFHILVSPNTLFPKRWMMRARLEARVHGLVQGVFFRHFTQLKARDLALAGTVCNQPDGTVCVVAEGQRADLNLLLEWLHHGPELARVDRVDVIWGQPHDHQTGFTILR